MAPPILVRRQRAETLCLPPFPCQSDGERCAAWRAAVDRVCGVSAGEAPPGGRAFQPLQLVATAHLLGYLFASPLPLGASRFLALGDAAL